MAIELFFSPHSPPPSAAAAAAATAAARASFLAVSRSMISFLVSVGADRCRTFRVGEERDIPDEDVLEE